MDTLKVIPYGPPPYKYEATLFSGDDIVGDTLAEGLPTMREAMDAARSKIASRGLSAIVWDHVGPLYASGRVS